jgi:hypothetical protein
LWFWLCRNPGIEIARTNFLQPQHDLQAVNAGGCQFLRTHIDGIEGCRHYERSRHNKLQGGPMARSYPKTAAAWRKKDRSNWDIGDALLEECGPPPKNYLDSNYQRIEAAADFIFKAGQERPDVKHLAKMRAVAHAFPKASRRPQTLTWQAHVEIGSPEHMHAILQHAKGKPVNSKTLYDIWQELRELEEAEARADQIEAEKAVIKARDKRQKATSDKERWEAENEINHAEGDLHEAKSRRLIKKPPLAKVKKHKEPMVAYTLARATGAEASAREARKMLDDRVQELTLLDIDAIADAALSAANLWREVAEYVRKTQRDKRSHLSVA